MGFWGALFGVWRHMGRHRYVDIGILYVAADFEQTQRVITIGAIDNPGGGPAYITAYCHLRHAPRTFRSDRIVGFFDPETGEAMRNVTIGADGEAFRKLLFFDSERPAETPFINIAQAETCFRERMEAIGWTVRVQRDAWSERLDLHRPFRRGVGVLKQPSVSLCHDPIYVDGSDELEGRIIAPGRPRDRPWAVVAISRSTGYFAAAAEAAQDFELAAAEVWSGPAHR
jgi:hypothetical protein